jgi:hypothetical protein
MFRLFSMEPSCGVGRVVKCGRRFLVAVDVDGAIDLGELGDAVPKIRELAQVLIYGGLRAASIGACDYSGAA